MRRGGDCKRQGKYRLGGADQRVVRQLVSAWLVLPPIMNTVHDIIRRAYELLVTAANFLQSPLLLELRVYFFWQLFLTGKGKLSNIGKVSEFFTSLGIPLPTLKRVLYRFARMFRQFASDHRSRIAAPVASDR